MKAFLHNCIAHPLWWATETLASLAEWLHNVTAPEGD